MAHMVASKGQRVEVQITSGRWSLAQISKVVDGDVVNLVAVTDGVDPWPTVDTPNGLVAGSLSNVSKGASVGQWRELDMPATEQSVIASIASESVSLVGYATEAYVDEATDGYQELPADCGYAVTGLTITMSARNPSGARSDEKSTHVIAVVTWAASITGTAALEVVCDSSSSPTTVVLTVPFSATLALGVQAAIPVVVPFDVPEGWSYKIRAASGSSGAMTLASVRERAI